MNLRNAITLMSAIAWVLVVVEFGESRPDRAGQTDDRWGTTANTTTGRDLPRGQRWGALWELATMVRCTTGKRIVKAIYDYAWYGCYCGFGGEGEPVDGTDRCCMIHDNCYDVAFRTKECPVEPQVYFVPYRGHFTMQECQTNKSRITCDSSHVYPWWHLYPKCAAAICQCDAAVSMCLGRNRFDPGHAWYPKHTCKQGPPVTLGPTDAPAAEDRTDSTNYHEGRVASEIETLFPIELSVGNEEHADPNSHETGSPDRGLEEGAMHFSTENEIVDEGMTFDPERRRLKMARHKQGARSNFLKRKP